MNLDAVGAALLADARADAASLLAAADQDARDHMARCRGEAAALVEAARSEGEHEAAERLARQHAATRREAREIVLAAQRQTLVELRAHVRAAARELTHEDRYEELLDRLRTLAASQLGPDAAISVAPDGEPGIVGSDGHRRVDYRLVTLADRALDAMGADIATLWM